MKSIETHAKPATYIAKVGDLAEYNYDGVRYIVLVTGGQNNQTFGGVILWVNEMTAHHPAQYCNSFSSTHFGRYNGTLELSNQ